MASKAQKEQTAPRTAPQNPSDDKRVYTDEPQKDVDATPSNDAAPQTEPVPTHTKDAKSRKQSKVSKHEEALRELASGAIVQGQVVVSKKVSTFAQDALDSKDK